MDSLFGLIKKKKKFLVTGKHNFPVCCCDAFSTRRMKKEVETHCALFCRSIWDIAIKGDRNATPVFETNRS